MYSILSDIYEQVNPVIAGIANVVQVTSGKQKISLDPTQVRRNAYRKKYPENLLYLAEVIIDIVANKGNDTKTPNGVFIGRPRIARFWKDANHIWKGLKPIIRSFLLKNLKSDIPFITRLSFAEDLSSKSGIDLFKKSLTVAINASYPYSRNVPTNPSVLSKGFVFQFNLFPFNKTLSNVAVFGYYDFYNISNQKRISPIKTVDLNSIASAIKSIDILNF